MRAPKRDSAATKARILAAATVEFAAHGLVGARVDRIAAASRANKNMIYIYFENKERLFDIVLAGAILELMETVFFTPGDLGSYAGALFDHVENRPELSRLARWHGLERPGGMVALEQVVAGTSAKIEAVAAAQAAGSVTAALTADQIVSVVVTLAATWSAGSPEATETAAPAELVANRRAAVVWAVRRLTVP